MDFDEWSCTDRSLVGLKNSLENSVENHMLLSLWCINSLKEKLILILDSVGEDCDDNISIDQNNESSEMIQMDEENESLLNIILKLFPITRKQMN